MCLNDAAWILCWNIADMTQVMYASSSTCTALPDLRPLLSLRHNNIHQVERPRQIQNDSRISQNLE
jgi:hypothetical protein